mgnify:CR=1 FL=1
MGFEPDSDDDVVVITAPVADRGPPEVLPIPKSEFPATSLANYRPYKTACHQLPSHDTYEDATYQIGIPGVHRQTHTYDVQLAPMWAKLDAMNTENQFGYFVKMARHSKASVYKLQASSFVERVNSAGKIVFSDSNLSLSSDKVEMWTMLRMNRKWMAHMRLHYPECTADLMLLLRKSHDALNAGPPPNDKDAH